MALADVIAEVVRVEGQCVVYSGGERIYFRGAEINLEKSDKICYHALPSILHYVNAFRMGAMGPEFGLCPDGEGQRDGCGYVACVDPGPPFTSGGRVIFKLTRVGFSEGGE